MLHASREAMATQSTLCSSKSVCMCVYVLGKGRAKESGDFWLPHHTHPTPPPFKTWCKIQTRVSGIKRKQVSSSCLSCPWTQKHSASAVGCLACSVVPVLSRDLRYSSACWEADPTPPACRDAQSLWFCTFKLNWVQRSMKTTHK